MNLERPERESRLRTALKVLATFGLFYIFLTGIKLMGKGCDALAHGEDSFAHQLIVGTNNPFIGLFVGVLVTSVIQSSGVATSIVVALVAAGTLPLKCAVPIIMGANIGTTVTNLLVSLGYIMRKDEFRRAISGAVVHDLFNVLTVLVLFPLEVAFGYLQWVATGLTEIVAYLVPGAGRGGTAGATTFNPLGVILDPGVNLMLRLTGTPTGPGWTAVVTGVVGLACIFFALFLLIKTLQSLVLSRAESFIGRVVGKSGWMGVLIGIFVTALIHSSSVTTSVLVPMAAAGIATVGQIFPITVGANIGTTITALIAALAGGTAEGMPGVTIALTHFVFNVHGMLVFFVVPVMRRIPVGLAERVGAFAAERKRLFVVLGIALFYGVPGLLILLSRVL